MKKSIVITLLCIFGFTQANAQVSFSPGIRGGLNFSHFTKGNNDYEYNDTPVNTQDNFSSKTDFYVGLYGALKLSKYYTLQPEIDYSRQGSTYKSPDLPKVTLDVSYLSLIVVNKFTFTDKFNVHVGPTIDFVVDNNFDNDSEVDLAFLLGAGYNFTPNFGIEARIKKGIVPVIDLSSSNHTNVVFQTGITYTFDIKK